MLKAIYARLDALCRARPKTVALGMVLFTTAAFLFNPAVWKHPVFAAWIAAAVLLPVPIEVWALVRRKRSGGSLSKWGASKDPAADRDTLLGNRT